MPETATYWTKPIAEAVDTHLRAFVDDVAAARLGVPPNLADALRYALLGGGKRVRPVLAWCACEAVGGNGTDALPAGAAVELVHAFSLVHDDLPALDDDELRRGKPTLHKHAGEPMAVLAGDQLLTLAFGALGEPAAGGRAIDATTHRRLVAELVAGTTGMIVGQTMDMGLDTPPGDDELARLEAVHRGKTGALIRAACRMGAIAGGVANDAPDPRLEAVSRYADAVGLQFQVVDDLLDATATTEQLGKAAGKDADAGKTTYPAILGIVGSRALARDLAQRATDALSDLGPEADPLRRLSRELADRSA
ncbi:MAG: farnesyl-diphosphate synthase [Phycisphaeraceae bacterium]|nr:MAG: farnesyl-diphosphate synthase [Phycisphaeraceae bacterium]